VAEFAAGALHDVVLLLLLLLLLLLPAGLVVTVNRPSVC
jgi:hypothetical protein